MSLISFLTRAAKKGLFISLHHFAVLCIAPIGLMLILIYSGIAGDLFGIHETVDNVRQNYLPSIVRAHRTLSDTDSLRQHAEIIMMTDDPDLRRRSRITAHAITSKGMFGDDQELMRSNFEIGEQIRRLAELRDNEDQARDMLYAAAFRLTETVNRLSRFLDRAENDRMRTLLFADPAEKTDMDRFRSLVENEFRQLTPLIRLCAASTSQTTADPALLPICGAFSSGMLDMKDAWTELDQADMASQKQWSRLDALLRQASDRASRAETRNIEHTMKTIALDVEDINHFFHRAFIFLILFLGILLFMLHRYMFSPIVLAGAQLRKIRNGTFRESEETTQSLSPGIQIRELAELFSLLPELRRHLAALDERSATLEREKERYEEMSLHDGLTGAFNRRSLDQRLAEEDEATPLAVLMVDVDFFKRYNDTYGHQAGDACLISIVRALKTGLRATDGVYRYGGEEFIVLLPGALIKDAVHVADVLRKRVHNLALPHKSSSADTVVTVSIGVAARGPDCPLSGEALVKRADEALYKAKEAGRNRSQAYEPQP